LRVLRVLYGLAGLALLVAVLANVDLHDVLRRVADLGWRGLAIVLTIQFFAFLMDSVSWHLTVPAVPFTQQWAIRFWLVRMVGEAFNLVMPAAGMGGEPVKVVLLKDHYGLPYDQGAASLVLARTINMIALMGFLSIGFVLIVLSPDLSGSYKAIAAAGFVALGIGTGLMFAIQRLRLASRAGSYLGQWKIGARILSILHHIEEFDERLVTFYTRHGKRLAWALTLAFINWTCGALEIYLVMDFLGHPVSLTDAWIIEAMTQMVRTGTFFIPASIGAQEGIFVVMFASIAGSADVGAAFAVVRRIRELSWAALGGALTSLYSRGRRLPRL
jgi:glycosyltransferase 2 family protein